MPPNASADPRRPLTVLFGSCIQNPDGGALPYIQRSRPDLFILLGDGVYLDEAQIKRPGYIRAAYRAQFSNLTLLGRIVRTVKTLSVWDDHDFGPNNSDSSFPLAADSYAAFQEVFHAGPVIAGTVAQEHRIGTVLFLLTDNRSKRIQPGGGKMGAYFGEEQLRWIESRLNAPHADTVVVVSGNQMLVPDSGYEGLSQYSEEQGRLRAALQASPAQVVLVSGDRHFGTTYREHGARPLIELTASPISARVAPSVLVDAELAKSTEWTNATYHAFVGQNVGRLRIGRDGTITGEILAADGTVQLEERW